MPSVINPLTNCGAIAEISFKVIVTFTGVLDLRVSN